MNKVEEKAPQLTPQEFIEKYRVQLESEIHKISRHYLLRLDGLPERITMSSLHSPMWYNIDGIYETIEDDMESPLRVSFKSIHGHMSFSILVPREGMEELQHLHMDLWGPFKRFRTKFLEENYPNIRRVLDHENTYPKFSVPTKSGSFKWENCWRKTR
jgi:hypothetical protein